MAKAIVLAGLFTSATQTAYDVDAMLKANKAFADYSVEMVSTGATSCADADIVICASYTALVSVKNYLNENMVVIVCDGPLVVSCLTTATPLDYIRRISYKFEFRPIDLKPVLQAVKRPGKIELLADNYDVIDMVTAASMSGGLVLTELNKVQSYFDALARNRLRYLFIEALNSDEPKSVLLELRDFLQAECKQEAHLADAGKFFKKFVKGGALMKLRTAIKELDDGKNIVTVSKKHEIELFELNYIRKMARNLDTAAGRTEAYATRTKSMAG